MKGNSDITTYVWIHLSPVRLGNSLEQYYIGTLAHEIGHNLGLHHPIGFNLNNQITYEYGDIADFMGLRFYMPNSYHRFAMQWMNGKITTLSGPGIYEVYLLPVNQVQDKGNKSVLIDLKDSSGNPAADFMLLELRRSFSYDTFTPQYVAYTKGGLGIRYGNRNLPPTTSRSWLLNTRPEIIAGEEPLALGRSITDPRYGVTVENLSYSVFRGGLIRVTLTR